MVCISICFINSELYFCVTGGMRTRRQLEAAKQLAASAHFSALYLS